MVEFPPAIIYNMIDIKLISDYNETESFIINTVFPILDAYKLGISIPDYMVLDAMNYFHEYIESL